MGASSVWLAIVYMYIMAQNPAQGVVSDYVYAVSAILVSANMGILFLSTSVMVAVTKARQREEDSANRRINVVQMPNQEKPPFTEEDLQAMTLRQFTYGDPDADNGGRVDSVCIICLLGYQDGDPVRQLRCNHIYHESCIDAWLMRSTSGRALCPMRCPPNGYTSGDTGSQPAPPTQRPAVSGTARQSSSASTTTDSQHHIVVAPARRRAGRQGVSSRSGSGIGGGGGGGQVVLSAVPVAADHSGAAAASVTTGTIRRPPVSARSPLPESIGRNLEEDDDVVVGNPEWVIDVDEAFAQHASSSEVVEDLDVDSEQSAVWEL